MSSCTFIPKIASTISSSIIKGDFKKLNIRSNLNTEGAKAVKTNKGNIITIDLPFNSSRPSEAKSKIFGQVNNVVKQLNLNYHSGTFGDIASMFQYNNGFTINIHPSQKLSNALTEKNKLEGFSSIKKLFEIPTNTFNKILQKDPSSTFYRLQQEIGDITKELARLEFEIDSLEQMGNIQQNSVQLADLHYQKYNKTKVLDLLKERLELTEALYNNKPIRRSSNIRANSPIDIYDEGTPIRTDKELYSDAKKFYRSLLKGVESKIRLIERQLGKGFSNEDNLLQELNRLNREKTKYIEYTNIMDSKSNVAMKRLLQEELFELQSKLENGIIEESTKDRIDLLSKVIRGSSLEQENYDKTNKEFFESLNLPLNDIINLYYTQLPKIGRSIIESDINFQNSFGHLTDEEKNKLFEVGRDNEFWSKYLMGIGQNLTGKDSIIPQVLKSLLDTAKAEHDSFPKELKARFLESAKKLGKSNLNWVFEKSKYGNNTGNIINYYSYEFEQVLKDFINAAHFNTEEKTEDQIFREQISILKGHTHVIDIRKLAWIKDKYYDGLEGFFTFDNSSMESYENELKELLGPMYEVEMEKIEKKLDSFYANRLHLLSEGTEESMKQLLSQNPFAWVRNYYDNARPKKILSMGGNNGEIISVNTNMDLNNFFFIPKKTLRINGQEVDSGYYNEDFKEVIKDKDKFDYWKNLTALYENYINPIYGKSKVATMSYGKLEEDFWETFANLDGVNNNETIKKAGLDWVFKSLYKEANNVVNNGVFSNYTDTVELKKKEARESLKLLSLEELQQKAKELKLNIPEEEKSRRIYIREIANKIALKGYSKDLNRVTISLVDLASFHSARQDILPKARIILDYYKTLKDTNGKERSNSIAKMENYIDTIIRNKPEIDPNYEDKLADKTLIQKIANLGGNNMDYIPTNSRALKYFSNVDKETIKIYEKLQKEGVKEGLTSFTFEGKTYKSLKKKSGEVVYVVYEEESSKRISKEDFEKIFQDYLAYKINNTGISMTLGSASVGIQKFLIMKGMWLNPKSGIINRIEGKDTNWRIDATGQYWTKGNIDYATNFLSFANVANIATRVTGPFNNRMKQLNILRSLINDMDIIQDRKAVLDKNISLSQNSTKEWLNGYAMAIDNPEFKNQAEIVLAILMDTKVKDNNGNEVPIFNRDTNEFNIFEYTEDGYRLKDEFKTYNENTWGKLGVNRDNIDNNSYVITRAKIKNAISRSQGNYETTDTVMLTNYVLGRMFLQFKRWMPEHVVQRWGASEDWDLYTGKRKEKGSFVVAQDYMSTTAITGLTYGALLSGVVWSPMLLAGGIGLGGYVVWNMFKGKYSKKAVTGQVSEIKLTVDFMLSILANSLNYPLRYLKVPSKWRFNDSISTQDGKISLEDAQMLASLARLLSSQIVLYTILTAAYAMFWDEDDDEVKANLRLFDNQINKLFSGLNMYLNPEEWFSNATRVGAFALLKDTVKLAIEVIDPDKEVQLKSFMKVTPVGGLIKDLILGETLGNDRDYTPGQWMENVGKNYATNGEHMAKKEAKKIKEKIKDKLREKIKEDFTGNDQELEDLLEEVVRKEIGNKNKDQTYGERVEELMDYLEGLKR